MEIIDLKGFQCVNFQENLDSILAGKMDVYNPCSFCKNRKNKSTPGPAFFYKQYNHWEFPFVAESNCSNFSAILTGSINSYSSTNFKVYNEVLNQKNKINDIGRKYNLNWAAFEDEEILSFLNLNIVKGKVTYPYNLSATEFYREVNSLKSDIFEINLNIKDLLKKFELEYNIRDSKLDHWINETEKNFSIVLREIEFFEDSIYKSKFNVISKWILNTVASGVTYDQIKHIIKLILGS